MLIKIHTLDSVDSTQTYAKAQLPHLDPACLTIFSAHTQTAGYGRRGTPWLSPPHLNLYATFCFTLSNTTPPHQIAPIAALSMQQLLASLSIKAAIKWPNDILVDHKKIAGILIETTTDSMQRRWALCGIGVNINATAQQLQSIDQAATSIFEEINQLSNPTEVLKQLSTIFNEKLILFFQKGFSVFLEEYRQDCVHRLNDPIYFKEKQISEAFIGIDDDGALLTQNVQGAIYKHY